MPLAVVAADAAGVAGVVDAVDAVDAAGVADADYNGHLVLHHTVDIDLALQIDLVVALAEMVDLVDLADRTVAVQLGTEAWLMHLQTIEIERC